MDASAIPAGTRPWLRPQTLDRIEQVVIALLWVWLVRRVIVSPNAYAPLLLLSETAVMVFVLIRRPTQAISLRLGDWLLAITATAAPLLIQPGYDLFPAFAPVGLALLFFGNCGQLYAKLALRRSFGVAPANRGIKISGPYRLVRHPMYAGYLLVHIGSLLLFFSPMNVLIYTIGWWAQVRRLLAEEALLSRDDAYRAYCASVRWRLLPGLF
ncbi:MAG: isoprenylcysteine carboxylmethyltransferase family protein [Sphingomonadales bacterium]|nr:isoprenylcysteine carboxylmethyltransferase family protein [Sphingomonadales bacterium]